MANIILLIGSAKENKEILPQNKKPS